MGAFTVLCALLWPMVPVFFVVVDCSVHPLSGGAEGRGRRARARERPREGRSIGEEGRGERHQQQTKWSAGGVRCIWMGGKGKVGRVGLAVAQLAEHGKLR